MLWNWNTIDSCFISESWRVRSTGMFAGSCIGVVLLVMTLEMLRRAVKEYDRFLVRRHLASTPSATNVVDSAAGKASDGSAGGPSCAVTAATANAGYRPTVVEQAVRALLHMLQFAVAYFVMLLAMYYNGYIIICIFIGAYLGSFVFQWGVLGLGNKNTSAANEATVCCG
jgi:copper transporter 1